MIYGETGMHKLANAFKQRMVSFQFKLANSRKHTLSQYMLMKGFHDDVTNNYCSIQISFIENVLSSNGLSNICLHEGDGFSPEYVKISSLKWLAKFINTFESIDINMYAVFSEVPEADTLPHTTSKGRIISGPSTYLQYICC